MPRLATAGLLLLAALTSPLAAQSFTGTYTLQTAGGTVVTLTMRQDAAGRASGTMSGNGSSYQLAGALQGPELVGKATGNGTTVWFEASLDGAELHLILADVGPNGQPVLEQAKEIVFTRSGSAAPGAPPTGAPAPPPPPAPKQPATARGPVASAAPPAPAAASPQDRQLRDFLLSSPWCSFSYSQASGSTSTSRNVFLANGTLLIGTNYEGGTTNQNGGGNVDVGGGATGSYYGQSQGGQQARWQVQGGQLYVDLGQGMQPVPLQITRNSSGYPIITTGGKEYSQCR